MNKEKAVPHIELCHKIPEGSFEDSALVYICKNSKETLEFRDNLYKYDRTYKVVPAPVIQEIWEELGPLGMVILDVDKALETWLDKYVTQRTS